MRAWLIILGIVVGLGGVLCYLSTVELRLWWIFTMDNPLSPLSPLNPYSGFFMVIGFILFVVGLVSGRGED